MILSLSSIQLLQFTQMCMQRATEQVPPYGSKFSKHAFTQPQLIVLYCLKLKLRVSYRELIDWLFEMPRIQEVLGLRRLPHFTTVQKAFARLETAIWRMLQRISASLSVCGPIGQEDQDGEGSQKERSPRDLYSGVRNPSGQG